MVEKKAISHRLQQLKDEANGELFAEAAKYSPPPGRGYVSYLNAVQRKQVLNRIIDLYIEGSPGSEITQIVLKEFPTMQQSYNPESYIASLLTEASLSLIESHNNAFELIAINHLYMYEYIYRFCREHVLVNGQMTALKQKEKMLGLHAEDNILNIDIETQIDGQPTLGYDINRLTEEEADRFRNYLTRVT